MWCALACSALAFALPRAADDDLYALTKDLLVGAGVSALQTEGAWDADGEFLPCTHVYRDLAGASDTFSLDLPVRAQASPRARRTTSCTPAT